MELAIRMSAASKGAYKGEYSVSSGEVIDSNSHPYKPSAYK
ncbi:hypothetical protein [Vibrio parahaemolyticus]|nr:hypothetical protein [Vibrio parahaemolyticus]